jgi:hypothetical protein
VTDLATSIDDQRVGEHEQRRPARVRRRANQDVARGKVDVGRIANDSGTTGYCCAADTDSRDRLSPAVPRRRLSGLDGRRQSVPRRWQLQSDVALVICLAFGDEISERMGRGSAEFVEREEEDVLRLHNRTVLGQDPACCARAAASDVKGE